MSLQDKTLHLCSCNGTMPLDASALARALELVGELPAHTQLCQKELAAFADHAAGDVHRGVELRAVAEAVGLFDGCILQVFLPEREVRRRQEALAAAP